MNRRPPSSFHVPLDRPRFLRALALASSGCLLPGYLAEALTLSPEMTAEPYYPLVKNLPLDDDNDLIYLGDHTTPAKGLVTYLTGPVLDRRGAPVRNALVEIWHADRDGNYIYSSASGRNPACDADFQGYGRFLTGSTGAYLFRTIKPGLYDGRARHFHLAATVPGEPTRHTTQIFWNEMAYDTSGQRWETQNADDGIFNALTPGEQAAVNLNFQAVPGIASVWAGFDFVLGRTPVERA